MTSPPSEASTTDDRDGSRQDVDGLHAEDHDALAERGIGLDEARRQLDLLRHPPPPIVLDRPCTLGDGIVRLQEAQHADLLQRFESAARQGRFSRFVPASGAASRMFQGLSRGLAEEPTAEERQILDRFFEQLDRFAFCEELRRVMAHAGEDFETARRSGDRRLLHWLLEAEGLDYRRLPKGLIPFHRHPDGGGRSALEEHLRESAEVMAVAPRQPCRLHFTVPGTHLETCRAYLDTLETRLAEDLEQPFDISCSVQSPDTDTLALDAEGRPCRDPEGRLLFRPGGHGALIVNLDRWANTPGVDLVFIKNIDNIQPAPRRPLPVLWKRLLGGHLLNLEDEIHRLVELCRSEGCAASQLDDGLDFAHRQLSAPRPNDWPRWDIATRRRHLLRQLDRPLRICGVVANSGEPGGGPFWVRHADGRCSPQIVETSQIDRQVPDQAAILANASHFNPVDIVCRLRSHDGEVFDLPSFVDPDTAFIAQKSQHGRPLTALERPGLWNGAMAHWNTVFVEVPGATFAPVKSVFDLLRAEHQA